MLKKWLTAGLFRCSMNTDATVPLNETLGAPLAPAHSLGGLVLEGAAIVGIGLVGLHFAAKGVKALRRKVKSDLHDIFSL